MLNKKFLGLAMLCIFFTTGFCKEYPYRESGRYRQFRNMDKRLELVAKFIPKNPIVFEAGGHYGDDTKRFAKQWPGAKIFTFEPNPHAFEKLIVATEDFTNVNCFNLAVSNYNGVATLHVCHGSNGDNPVFEGASSLLAPSDHMKIHYQGPKVEVPCVVLDDWCKEHHVDHFDFLWLDLEGLEFQVLKSSPEVLRNASVIYAETNFQAFRQGMTQFNQLKHFLNRAGFEVAAHWYHKGLQGDAVFVKKELLKKDRRR